MQETMALFPPFGSIGTIEGRVGLNGRPSVYVPSQDLLLLCEYMRMILMVYQVVVLGVAYAQLPLIIVGQARIILTEMRFRQFAPSLDCIVYVLQKCAVYCEWYNKMVQSNLDLATCGDTHRG